MIVVHICIVTDKFVTCACTGFVHYKHERRRKEKEGGQIALLPLLLPSSLSLSYILYTIKGTRWAYTLIHHLKYALTMLHDKPVHNAQHFIIIIIFIVSKLQLEDY